MTPSARTHVSTRKPRCIYLYRQAASTLLLLLLLAGCGGSKQSEDKPKPKPDAESESKTADFGVTPNMIARPGDAFEEVADKSGIAFVQQYCDSKISNIIESNGSGAAIFDFDKDGFMDIYLVNPGPLDGVTRHKAETAREPNRLYRNRGDGTFEDVTVKAGVAGRGYGVAAAAGDYDNDGYPDLYIVNVGKNILYHNRGDGTFEDVTDKTGVGHRGTGIGAVWVDVDGDGRLDLFAASYLTYAAKNGSQTGGESFPGPMAYKPEFNVLYRNKGDGTFEDISEKAGIRIAGHRAMSVCAFDFNGDRAPDLYICNDGTPNLMLVNDGRGHFHDIASKTQTALNSLGEAAGSMTAAIGDCNGDLIADILVSRLGFGSLYMGQQNGMFDDRMMASGLGALTAQYVGWGCNFLDFDNDGSLDVCIANGDAHHMRGWEALLLKNDGTGKFSNAAEQGGAFFQSKIRARGSYVLDFDNDGRQDLLLTAIADRIFLLQNRAQSAGHWIRFDLEGTKSNRDGYGARIKVQAGGRVWQSEARCQAGYLGNSDPRVHFGLGSASKVDRVEILWPSGQTQIISSEVTIDRTLKIKEP